MQKYIIPLSIVIAGGLIAFAIVSSKNSEPKAQNTDETGQVAVDITPVSGKDHIRGNPDAEIIVVEYSDYQCPFCQQFHGTMQTLLDEYGKDGKIAWAYRHYPIDQIHPLARGAAEVAECVANIAGEDKFWAFTDNVFDSPNKALADADLDKIVTSIGVDATSVRACVASGDGAKQVAEDVADGDKIARANPNYFGTPYSILISKDGTQYPIVGALPYAKVKQAIETMLSE